MTRSLITQMLGLVAVLAVSGCITNNSQTTTPTKSNVISGPLSPLRAELDPVNGGRFVDAEGREVMLSGINVNSLGEYWQFDPNMAPVFPLEEQDADRFADIGWNAVRLVITWSRVEPRPGEYDEAHLDEIDAAIRLFESRGLYTIIDLHQDAWGPSLAARDNENCPEGTIPAVGWDGAPPWATLDKNAPRCYPDHPLLGEREFSPAVIQAFLSFWRDEEGPGGVGIQTRYHAMLSHLAQRFSKYDAVLGYDTMNEPNAWNDEILAAVAPGLGLKDQTEYLSRFYERALAAIRDGERKANSPNRLMLFEPSPDWALWPTAPEAVRPVFKHDGQVVYSPHIYQGGIVDQPLDEAAFQRARDDAAEYGGVPVLTGEWGAAPSRAVDPDDDYFQRHQALQDKLRVSATQWLWRPACGDPHFAYKQYSGVDPTFWGFYDVECPSSKTLGYREDYAAILRRPLMRAAPGRIDSILWDYKNSQFKAAGNLAVKGQKLMLFIHRPADVNDFRVTGLDNLTFEKDIGPGQIWSAVANGKDWTLGIVF